MAKRQTASFTLSEYLRRDAHAAPYDPFERRRHDAASTRPPVTRRLRIYTQDPSTPKLDVAVADAVVPFERLRPGPNGCVIRVIDEDETRKKTHTAVDLEALAVIAPFGVAPSTGNPQFAQQMTYAVAMATYDRFRVALGRSPDFSFGPRREGEPPDVDENDNDKPLVKLHIYPHGMREDNAFYDPERGALLFGYIEADRLVRGKNQPGTTIFTSLSHDIVVHEMTHALLDGMRSNFFLPTNPDVGAFHEAFSDLVALFQRFQYRELVRRAISQSQTDDLSSALLTDIAREWGQATGGQAPDPRQALRSALLASGGPNDPVARKYRYNPRMEVHDLGAVLVAAVFDAFRWIYSRKVALLKELAPPAGQRRPPELIDLLTNEAVRLSGQFLNIIIRAIDYCPPVDLTFGEYLRALITADFDLVPEDPFGYREAMVQAFRRYGITVDKVLDLSEDSLLWRPPEADLPPLEALAFPNLRHQREPGQVSTPSERRTRAEALGLFITQPKHRKVFGLVEPRRSAPTIEAPVVESIRTLRRIGPDDTVNFDLVAEVTQRRRLGNNRWFYGGATIIIDSAGFVRYAVVKSVDSTRRERMFRTFLAKKSSTHARLFAANAPRNETGELLQLLHRRPRARRRREG